MHGVLVVDKPGGMTSAAVVAKVKHALGVKRIGHTGTLDPMATGVLPLCVGEGTKIAGYLLASDKAYEGELVLGVQTDTLDKEGTIVAEDREAARAVSVSDLQAAIATQRGEIEQVPPMFSAIRQNGRRLHALARAGQEVERSARAVTVHAFELLSFAEGRARFSVAVSKGTYVRSLVDDIGKALACGAHLSELRRTQAGQFTIAEALSLENILEGRWEGSLIDPARAISHLDSLVVPPEWVTAVADGKRLEWQLVSETVPPDGPVALLNPEGGSLLAIATVEEERLRFRRVFNYGLTREARSSNVRPEIV